MLVLTCELKKSSFECHRMKQFRKTWHHHNQVSLGKKPHQEAISRAKRRALFLHQYQASFLLAKQWPREKTTETTDQSLRIPKTDETQTGIQNSQTIQHCSVPLLHWKQYQHLLRLSCWRSSESQMSLFLRTLVGFSSNPSTCELCSQHSKHSTKIEMVWWKRRNCYYPKGLSLIQINNMVSQGKELHSELSSPFGYLFGAFFPIGP